MIKSVTPILILLFLNACSFSTKPDSPNADMMRLGYYYNYGDQSYDNYIFHNDSAIREFAKNLDLSYRLILIDSSTFKDLQDFLIENKVDNTKNIKKGYSKEFLYVLVDTASVSSVGEKIHIVEYIGALKKYFETIENDKDRKQLLDMCDNVYKSAEFW